jgi:hypothetical protein
MLALDEQSGAATDSREACVAHLARSFEPFSAPQTSAEVRVRSLLCASPPRPAAHEPTGNYSKEPVPSAPRGSDSGSVGRRLLFGGRSWPTPAYKCGCLYGRPLPLDSPVRLFVFRAVGHSPLPKNESWRPRVQSSAILALVLRLDFRVSVPRAGLRATGAAAAPPGGAV